MESSILALMRVVLIIVIFLSGFHARGQKNSFWQTLGEVEFERRRANNGYSCETPLFSQNLRRWKDPDRHIYMLKAAKLFTIL